MTSSPVTGRSAPAAPLDTSQTKVTLPRFMAYDEGCYECGEPSGVIGFYRTRDEALAAVEAAEERQRANWHGQHSMFVIDLTAPTMSEHAS